MWRCACEAVGRLCGHDATAALLSVLDRGVCMASWVRNRGDAAATDEAVKGLRWRRDRLLCRTPVLQRGAQESLLGCQEVQSVLNEFLHRPSIDTVLMSYRTL